MRCGLIQYRFVVGDSSRDMRRKGAQVLSGIRMVVCGIAILVATCSFADGQGAKPAAAHGNFEEGRDAELTPGGPARLHQGSVTGSEAATFIVFRPKGPDTFSDIEIIKSVTVFQRAAFRLARSDLRERSGGFGKFWFSDACRLTAIIRSRCICSVMLPGAELKLHSPCRCP